MDRLEIQNLIQQGIKDYMAQSQYSVVKIPSHLHNGKDSPLITTVDLPTQTPIKLGLGAIISTSNSFRKLVAYGSTSEQIQTSIAAGTGQAGTVDITTPNMQFNLLHQPQNTNNQSFINSVRPPIYGTPQGTTVSTTAGGNTITISNYGFVVNSLANALINILDSSGTLVETQTIASNTSSVITISGTWLYSTSGGTFFIFQPVFMGSADTPFQRFYTQEGTGAGIRFGVGVTNGGQNGLLYMNATGDLYWRDKAGTSTKVFLSTSTPLSGTKTYYVSDTSGGAVTRKLTFQNGILTSET